MTHRTSARMVGSQARHHEQTMDWMGYRVDIGIIRSGSLLTVRRTTSPWSIWTATRRASGLSLANRSSPIAAVSQVLPTCGLPGSGAFVILAILRNFSRGSEVVRSCQKLPCSAVVEFAQPAGIVGFPKELGHLRRRSGPTENPRVGGSIPFLATTPHQTDPQSVTKVERCPQEMLRSFFSELSGFLRRRLEARPPPPRLAHSEALMFAGRPPSPA